APLTLYGMYSPSLGQKTMSSFLRRMLASEDSWNSSSGPSLASVSDSSNSSPVMDGSRAAKRRLYLSVIGLAITLLPVALLGARSTDEVQGPIARSIAGQPLPRLRRA